jgi:hypothetical protein
LNAGCRVTSIQKLLGHRRLNSTMIYARVHDRTVAGDYYAAMNQIEKGLDLALAEPTNGNGRVSEEERIHLLELISRLAEPRLDLDLRLNLVEQMRRLLSGEIPQAWPPETEPENQLFEMICPAVPLDAVAPVW